MNVIILGPQGSGKGTQAEMLSREFGLEHVDMGKFLREVAKQDNSLGKEIYQIQNVTKTLVPSRILRKVLHLKLQDLSREQGIVFDGVPRTIDQKEYLEEALRESGREIDAVIYINISEQESIKRIGKRWTCRKCGSPFIAGVDINLKGGTPGCPRCGGEIFQRADDSPEGVKKRLDIFRKETAPVIDSYRENNLLVEIDGKKKIEEVFEDIKKEIAALSKKS